MDEMQKPVLVREYRDNVEDAKVAERWWYALVSEPDAEDGEAPELLKQAQIEKYKADLWPAELRRRLTLWHKWLRANPTAHGVKVGLSTVRDLKTIIDPWSLVFALEETETTLIALYEGRFVAGSVVRAFQDCFTWGRAEWQVKRSLTKKGETHNGSAAASTRSAGAGEVRNDAQPQGERVRS